MKLGTEVGLGPSHIVLDGDPAHPLPQRGTAPQFSAHVYCGQTARWIKMPLGMEVGLGPGHIVLDGNPAHTGIAPQFSAHACCGLTAGWMKMPLTEVGLGPGDVVLGGGPSSPIKRCRASTFRPMSIVAKRQDGSRLSLGTKIGLGPGHILLDGDLDHPPPKGHIPLIFGPCLLWPNGRPSQLLLSTCCVCF